MSQPYEVIQTTGVKWQDPNRPVFEPTQEERDFVMKVYNDFVYDYSIKNQTWQVLNNRTLEQFWYESNYDYNVIVEQDENNPVTQYSSGISRDKANTFISNLTLQLLYPSISAMNLAQEKDVVISQISRPLLRYQYLNDGRPSESGKIKNVRYTHKQVVEGTVHILDTIGPDGRLTSTVIPNEEIFIPNFYQPDIQLQSHVIHAKQWASFAEAEAEFGELENFKYVVPGSLGWINQTFAFKEKYKALVYENQCSVVRAWYPVRQQELERLKKEKKLPKWVKKAKYFNIIINGVPMFPFDNLLPYYHGDYPITKAVFEFFSPAEFYWGNSMPNKARQDKKFLDGWKTLIRYKAKLAAIPALLNFTGQHIENDVYVPGITTDMPVNMDPTKIVAVPGTDKGVTNSDAMILQDATDDVQRATASPQTSGQQGSDRQTARETIVIEQNSQKIMMGLAQMIAFREEARAYPILKSTFQIMPRQDIKKIAIPDETFSDGSTGTLEVIFDKVEPMSSDERLAKSFEILKKQKKGKRQGNFFKQVTLDSEYIQHLDLYCEAVADQLPATTSAMREARAEYKWNLYSARPDLFNATRAARQLVRELGDNEKELIIDQNATQQNPAMQQMQQPGRPSPADKMRQSAGRQTSQLATDSII